MSLVLQKTSERVAHRFPYLLREQGEREIDHEEVALGITDAGVCMEGLQEARKLILESDVLACFPCDLVWFIPCEDMRGLSLVRLPQEAPAF